MSGKMTSDEMGELFEEMKDLVKRRGSPVLMESPYCKKRRPKRRKWWKRDSKCLDCESELGCNKVQLMMGVVMIEVGERVFGRKGCQEEVSRLEKLRDKILDAQTVEELDKIRDELRNK